MLINEPLNSRQFSFFQKCWLNVLTFPLFPNGVASVWSYLCVPREASLARPPAITMAIPNCGLVHHYWLCWERHCIRALMDNRKQPSSVVCAKLSCVYLSIPCIQLSTTLSTMHLMQHRPLIRVWWRIHHIQPPVKSLFHCMSLGENCIHLKPSRY